MRKRPQVALKDTALHKDSASTCGQALCLGLRITGGMINLFYSESSCSCATPSILAVEFKHLDLIITMISPIKLTLRYSLIAGFFPLVALVLGADSLWFAEHDLRGQFLADSLTALYLIVLLWGLDAEERLMVIIFVPFSALAEYIFSSVFEVYTYRLEAVPIYVPLGHAILFSTGLMLSKLPVFTSHNRIQTVLLSMQGFLFAVAILWLQDIFSAILCTLFGLILWWRGCRLIYPIMGFLVLYIELLGTRLGCWIWQENAFNLFATTNPPFGAFVFYVFGDIAVLKMSRYFNSNSDKLVLIRSRLTTKNLKPDRDYS